MEDMQDKTQKKIAYIHIQFPKLSETFIRREIESLEKLGMNIQNYSLKKPFPDDLNDRNRNFVLKTIYLPSYFSFGMIYSHLYWFLRHPVAYLATAWRVLSSRYPPGNMWLAVRKPLLFWRSVHLARIIYKDKSIVHLHAHFKYIAIVAWIVSRFTGHSYSFTAHFATNALMVGRIAEDARFVATVSEREKAIIKAAISKSSSTPVHLVRLGLPENYFAPTDEIKKPDVPAIISIGRLIPKKGYIFLLRVLAILAKRGKAFKALIVGDGPLMKELESHVVNFGLSDHVTLAGARDPLWVQNALDRSHVFALFCAYGPDGDVDGIPVAMMEAMARGLPVVTTRISALPELIVDGVTGFTVRPGDITGFADALEKLIEEPALREKMGVAAFEKVSREYRLTRQVSQMKALFDNILQGSR